MFFFIFVCLFIRAYVHANRINGLIDLQFSIIFIKRRAVFRARAG